METKEYTFIDKSKWPAGPWNNEPDKVQWQDEATGLPCIAKRHPRMGNWCGYVGVPPEHEYFNADYDTPDLDVHGGLTYADACQESKDEHGICHVPGPGESDLVWWFGFDCAHCGDASPQDYQFEIERGYPTVMPEDEYRTLDYVKQQCASLAQQLATIRTEPVHKLTDRGTQ